jgi:hypothetical protein
MRFTSSPGVVREEIKQPKHDAKGAYQRSRRSQNPPSHLGALGLDLQFQGVDWLFHRVEPLPHLGPQFIQGRAEDQLELRQRSVQIVLGGEILPSVVELKVHDLQYRLGLLARQLRFLFP